MSIRLQIEEMPGYLVARFVGAGSAEESWQQFELIAVRCKRANNNKLLIDSTGVQTKVSIEDTYRLGERFKIFARHGLKIAIVTTPEQIDQERFAELVARNRGVNITVFTDVKAAEKWLLT